MMLTRLRTVGVVGFLGSAAFSVGAAEARADHRSPPCRVRYAEPAYRATTVVYTERGRYYPRVRYYSNHRSYYRDGRSGYGHHRSARRHIGRGLRRVGRVLRHVGRGLHIGRRRHGSRHR